MGKVTCFHCTRKCKGDVLKVGEKYFHKECFTCKICQKKLDDTGFFSKDESFYCPEDYKKYCAAVCFSCQEKIIGEVVTALNHTFHKNCFKCSVCQKNFIPGDRVSMKNTNFLCGDCSGISLYQDKIEKKVQNETAALNQNNRPTLNGKPHSYLNQVDSSSQIKDSDSYSVPIRRKVVSNKSTMIHQNLSNSLNRPISSQSSKLRPISRENSNTDPDHIPGNSFTTPKHFHIPQGNNRYWMYNSMVVGSKNHPLALSACNINKLSSSSQRVSDNDSLHKDQIKKLSSYPSGHVDEKQEPSIERNDWPSPPAVSVYLTEKIRRKAQNPTVEALSAGTTPKIRKARSASQSGDVHANGIPTKMGIAEVLKRSTTDCSSYDHIDRVNVEETDIPKDPVSASRSPSAVCEPLVPPRYDLHMETSPSRNDDFIKQSERHLGYSMDFVNSTSRSFISDSAVPKYRKSLRNSYVELRQTNNVNHDGVALSKGDNGTLPRNNFSSNNDKNKYHSAILPRESDSFIASAIPYNQLRISNRRILKNLDRLRLETYLGDQEFLQLFNLTRQAFYQLPEWKRNDLKKQVDLF